LIIKGLFYLIFGNSKHLSVGTFAIISLLVLSTLQKIETIHNQQFNGTIIKTEIINGTEVSTLIPYDFNTIKVQVATTLALWTGLVQVRFN
jgi:MFS superfamily sulfate permease-like transporter